MAAPPPDLIGFISDEIHIDFDDMELSNELGRGSFGIVYRAKYCGIHVAAKSIKSGLARQSEFDHEVNILKGLRHPNIVMLIGVASDLNTGTTFIVQEFVSGGSLWDLLNDHKNKISYIEKLQMSLDIAQGLWYIHQRDILHRDLKAENILLDPSSNGYKCKIADFGVSRLFTVGDEPVYSVGSTWWRAPEMFSDRPYGKSADIFSAGVLLYEIITRKPGIDIRVSMTLDSGNQVFGVNAEKLWDVFHEELDSVPQEFVSIASHCCAEDPNERPKTSELFKSVEQLAASVTDFSDYLEKTLRAHCGNDENMVRKGKYFWLREIGSMYSSQDNFQNSSVPLSHIVHRFSEDLAKKSGRGLEESNSISDFCELIGSNPEDNVMLDVFVKKVWKFYYQCKQTILNPMVLPYWKNDMIMGFVGQSVCTKYLVKNGKTEGEFIIRFSTSSPGSLVMVCFHNNKIVNILTKVVQDKLILGNTSCSSITDLFYTSNLSQLCFVYPRRPLEELLHQETSLPPEDIDDCLYDSSLGETLPAEALAMGERFRQELESASRRNGNIQ